MASQSQKNKVVLVTGGARRIGAAIAQACHQQGFNVVIHYNSSGAEAEALAQKLNQVRPNSVSTLKSDLQETENCACLIDSAVSVWGQLDALVNNASIFLPTAVGETSSVAWDDLFSVNAKAPYFLSQAAFPALKQSQGCIVNLIDVHGASPLKDYGVYSMSKAALFMQTKSLAREMAPAVRVNGVSPGLIAWPEGINALEAASKQKLLQQVPLQRQGDPSEVANAVLFLISGATYTTGEVIAVAGGR